MSCLATYTCKCGCTYQFDEDLPGSQIICTNTRCDLYGRVSIPVVKTKPFDCYVCGKTMIIPQSLYKVGGTAVCPVCQTLYRVNSHKVVLNVAAENGQLVKVLPKANTDIVVKCPLCNNDLTLDINDIKSDVEVICPSCDGEIKLGPHGYRVTRNANDQPVLATYYKDTWIIPNKIVRNGITYYKLAFQNQLKPAAAYVRAVCHHNGCPLSELGNLEFFADPATTFAGLNLPYYSGSEPTATSGLSQQANTTAPVWYTNLPWNSESDSL